MFEKGMLQRIPLGDRRKFGLRHLELNVSVKFLCSKRSFPGLATMKETRSFDRQRLFDYFTTVKIKRVLDPLLAAPSAPAKMGVIRTGKKQLLPCARQ
jgi:hypothetical protein